MLYRGGSDIVAKGAMFAITVGAARQLPRDEFALFALASTLGWLGSIAADFGIQVHLARSVAQRPEASSDALGRWIRVRMITGAAALVLALAVLRALGFTQDTALPATLFTLAYAGSGLTECLYYFFRGLDRTDIESTLTVVQRAAMCGLAFVALRWQPSVTRLAVALLVPAVLTLALAALIARRLAAPARAEQPVGHEPVGREFVTSVAPIGLGILLSALYFRIDLFLLEQWSGTSSVAIYNAVFRIVDALRLFPAAVLAVALPALCRATDLRPLLRLAAPLTAAAMGTGFVLFAAAPWVVPLLYGSAYRDGIAPFRTLMFSLPMMALNYALTQQLIGWHGHRAYASICAAALAFNVALNWQLIPRLGMSGAAWATLWTEAVLTAGCAIAIARLRMRSFQEAAPEVGTPLEVRS
jgi:O-antigen/teichoic acid export membrane protein